MESALHCRCLDRIFQQILGRILLLDLLRLFSAYIILFFGLGWLVIPILFRGDDFSFLDKCAIAFSLSVGTISVLGTAFYFLDNDLSVVQSSLLILLVVVLLVRAVGWWRGKKSGTPESDGKTRRFFAPYFDHHIFCYLLFTVGPLDRPLAIAHCRFFYAHGRCQKAH
jgi:hypothetical protein